MSHLKPVHVIAVFIALLFLVSPASAAINIEGLHTESTLAIGHLATTVTYSGTTVNAPTWTRPYQGPNCSLNGPEVRYHAQEFTVDTTGMYQIISEQTYDGYIHLYENNFDPNAPCTNYLNGDDDTGNGSALYNQQLTAGTSYILITSAYSSYGSGSFTNTITRVAGLVVSQSNNGPVGINEEVTITIQVTNQSQTLAKNVILTDHIDHGLSIVTLPTNCTQSEQTITCNLGDIDIDGTEIIELKVTSSNMRSYGNITFVNSDTPQSNTHNNHSYDYISFIAPDIDIQQHNNGPVEVGEELTFTLVVENLTNISVENVVLTNTLPDDVTVVSISPEICTQSAEIVTCNLGDFSGNQSTEINIVVTSAMGGRFINNEATVTTDSSESNTANNSNTNMAGIIADGDKPEADIVFLFDESGSMDDEIEEVKTRVNDIVSLLDIGVDYRLGLVGFGSYHNNGAERIHQRLTGSETEFANALNNLVYDGGNEVGFDAVVLGLSAEMNFRERSGVCTIMITDEDSDAGDYSQADAITALNNRNAIFLGIVNPYGGYTSNHYGPDSGSLAEATGGEVFNIQDFRVDAQPVLAAIIEKCVGEISVRQGVIGDTAWHDVNQNGLQDENEPGLAGVIVNLFNTTDDTLQATTTTDSNGSYEFSNLAEGSYYVQFELPTDYTYTVANQGEDDARDSDADPVTGKTTTINLANSQEAMGWDVGLIPIPTGTLWVHKYHDLNGNAQLDNGEAGLNDWRFTISSTQVSDIVTTTHTVDGQPGWFIIEGLQPGQYTICETLQPGWQNSTELCQMAEVIVDQDTVVQFGNYQPAAIRVINQTTPDNGTVFDFLTSNLNPAIFQLSGGETYSMSNLLPGNSYGITETVNSGWQLISATCNDGSPVDAISLTSGETVTCTFVNQAEMATLTVIKEVIGQTPSHHWEFNGASNNGSTTIETFTLPAEGGQQSFSLLTGVYTLTESFVEGYLQSVICNDGSKGDAQVTVSLQPNQSLTCTFTNVALTGESTLVIAKEASEAGVFGFTSDIPDWDNFSLNDDASTEVITLTAGAYTIQEDPNSFPGGVVANWSLITVSCVDAADNLYLANSPADNGITLEVEHDTFTAKLTMPAGLHLTCTFLNERADIEPNPSNNPIKSIYLPLITQ